MSAPIQTTQSLLAQLQHLPTSIAEDVEALLAEHPVTTPAELQTLATFINAAQALVALPQYQAMQHEDAIERHCVRCHATFTNGNNQPTACTIPHVFDTEPSFTGEVREDKIYSYRSACCGSVELEEQGAGNLDYLNADELGWCSEDYHTTDVDADEEEYNGINIHRCKIDKESGECVRTWIDEENPVWGWQIR